MEQEMTIGEQGEEFRRWGGGPGLEIIRHQIHSSFQIFFILMNRADAIGRFADRDDVHAPVGVSASDAADQGRAADRGASVFTGENHTKRDLVLDDRLHHSLVSWFKNMQRQSHPGQEDNVEREKRDVPGGHYRHEIVTLWASAMRRKRRS